MKGFALTKKKDFLHHGFKKAIMSPSIKVLIFQRNLHTRFVLLASWGESFMTVRANLPKLLVLKKKQKKTKKASKKQKKKKKPRTPI